LPRVVGLHAHRRCCVALSYACHAGLWTLLQARRLRYGTATRASISYRRNELAKSGLTATFRRRRQIRDRPEDPQSGYTQAIRQYSSTGGRRAGGAGDRRRVRAEALRSLSASGSTRTKAANERENTRGDRPPCAPFARTATSTLSWSQVKPPLPRGEARSTSLSVDPCA